MINQKKPIIINTILLYLFCSISISCGTLGVIGPERYFPISKDKLEVAMDSIYSKHPEYIIPAKWEKFNDWTNRGYDFMESRIYYFKSSPEEMYYITFMGDSSVLADTTKISIGIRAIYKGNPIGKWLLNHELNSKDKQRILNRFDNEIISKLEVYTKTHVSK